MEKVTFEVGTNKFGNPCLKVILPKIPLYGRYNPIPREERISKITGLPHPTGLSAVTGIQF